MSTFTYKYGSYTHEVGEITDFRYQLLPHMTRRALRDTNLVRATLTGRFLGCDYSEIKTKIANFLDAYGTNNRKFAMYHPDGSETRYVLDPADEYLIAGPYVVDCDWPTGEGAEYVTKRDFRIVLEGIVVSLEDQVIQFEESVRHVGTAMPSWEYQNTLAGPIAYQIWPATTMMVIQSGSSIGFGGYYAPGWLANFETLVIPVLPLQYEHAERRIETLGAPLVFPRKRAYYPAQWQYTFETNFPGNYMPP
ncbi:MAG: hypothetical protein MUE50_06665 [Pirellulaceae bacterium]|jgi:hypothetical protein|nr:hypothetical protein [Pirellulaceae bacterium]